MERSLESSGKVPRIVQVMYFKDLPRPSANQQAEQSLPQVWEAQWQQVLTMLQHSHAGWGNPQLTDAMPWDDTKAFLSAFEQVAEACRWPREEWVGRLLPALRGGMEQMYCRLDARERGDYGKVKAALLRGDAMQTESKRQHFRQCGYQELEGPRRIYSRLQELCHQWLKPDHRTKEQILELIIQEQLLAMLPAEAQNWVRECGPKDCIETVALAEDFLMGRQATRMWKWPDMTVNSSEAEGPLTDNMARQQFAGIRQKHEGELRLTNEKVSARNSGFMLPPERQEMAGASLSEGLANLRERSAALERAGWTAVDPDQKPLHWEFPEENCGNVNGSEGLMVPTPPDQGSFFLITETGETITAIIPGSRIRGEIKVENDDEEEDTDAGDSFEAATEEPPEAVPTSSGICRASLRRKLRPREPETPAPAKPKQRGRPMKPRKKSVPAVPKRQKEKKHRCTECGHRTCYWSDMLRHMNTHNGRRPYRCPDCGRTFSRLSSFQTHQKLHLPATRLKGIKRKVGRPRAGKYACSTCGKREVTVTALAEHVRVHSKDGRYPCQECGKSFRWMTSLWRHWREGCKTSKSAAKPRAVEAVHGASAHQETADSKDELAALLGKTLGPCEESPISRLRPRKPQRVIPETSGAGTSMPLSTSLGRRPYKCENCGQTFGWSSNYFRHCLAGCTKTPVANDTLEEHQATRRGDEELRKVKQEEIKTEDEYGMWPVEIPGLAECDVILDDEEELIHILERNAQKGGTKMRGLLGTSQENSSDEASETTENSEIGALPKPRGLPGRRRQGTSTQSQKTALVVKKSKYSQKEKKHKCSVCGQRCYYLSDLVRHMRVHTGERPFKCHECGKTFTQTSALRFHQKVRCGPCNRSGLMKDVTNRKGGKGLVKRARSRMEEPFKCTECGRGFRWVSNLYRHQRLHQSNRPASRIGRPKMDAGSSKPRKMVVENPLKGRAALKRERDSGTSAEITRGDASVTVVINDIGWKSRSGKKLAGGNLARVGRPSKSGAAYRYKSRLTTSQKALAKKKKALQCNVCGKSFKAFSLLVDHENSHTGARPYKCLQCGKNFSWKTKLLRHQKIHTGVKPYRCPECGKAFFRKDGLMIHLKSHGSSCMYACSHCGVRFMEREELFRHQKSHVRQ